MPISPDQVVAKQVELIPDEVFEVWDRLIAHNWNGQFSYVMQNDAITALIPLTELKTRGAVFQNKWLDIEEAYRAAGWKVEYDKPHYSENYEASFKFTKK